MHWEPALPPDPIQLIEPGSLSPPDAAVSVLGGKALNLLKLVAEGFPVPPAFVLPTSMCARWISEGAPSRDEFRQLVAGPLDRLERATGMRFGDTRNPLLVSVRSGAPASMPGMLDTVLNVGLTAATLPGLVAQTGNPRLAWDCLLRLIESYAETVRGIDINAFKQAMSAALAAAGADHARQLDTLSLRDIAATYREIYEDLAGEPFPDDPLVQLQSAVEAVFRSWNSERARTYRRNKNLDGLAGTAVTVQRMVYGNAGPRSGAGVGFTRDPATGEKRVYLDFAFDAQGEDVVSGRCRLTPAEELKRLLPESSQALEHMAARLESLFADVQDFEFTIEEGQLFLLQTRAAKRSSWARLKIAVDLAREGVIAPKEALCRLDGLDLASVVRRQVKKSAGEPIAHGISAGIGCATGAIAFTVERAAALAAKGQEVILVRNDIATDDVEGLIRSEGVLTARGGRTSHAAVVARELGKVAIVGCKALDIAADESGCRIGERTFSEGAVITLDGETGAVFAGAAEVEEIRPEAELAQLQRWRSKAA
jgi:pyruvate,orthophosphate dikinase